MEVSKEERAYMAKEGLTNSPGSLYGVLAFIALSIGLIIWWIWSIFNA